MTYPEKLTEGYYYVRDGNTVISRHQSLTTAKKYCDAYSDSAIYTEDGTRIYPGDEGDTGNTGGRNTQPEPTQPRIAVLKSKMNVRKEPSLSADIVDVLTEGTEVAVESVVGVTEPNDSWLKARLGGETVYILYNGGQYAEMQN